MNKLDESIKSLEQYERELRSQLTQTERQLAKTHKALETLRPIIGSTVGSRALASADEKRERQSKVDDFLLDLPMGARFTIPVMLQSISMPVNSDNIHIYGSIISYRSKINRFPCIKLCGQKQGRYQLWERCSDD